MRRAKTIVLLAGLLLAVGAAVASVAAQDEGPRSQARRGVIALDGRGAELGVTVRDVEADAKTPRAAGVRIDEVAEGGPAEKAGLRAGDVVVEFDGERVRSARQFVRLVRETPEGRTVAVAVVRDGQRRTLDVTPEGRASALTMTIDGDRIRRDVERRLRDLPDVGALRIDPGFDFEWDALPRGRSWAFPPDRGKARLGVTVQTLSSQLAEYFGAKDGGALVASVAKASAAERAGLKAGDVITAVNGDRVRDADDLADELSGVSGEASIDIVRDRKPQALKAVLP